MLKGHGGDIYRLARQLGCRPEDILDFSSNCSPLPFPDGFESHVLDHLHQLHWLPEVESESAKELLSEIYRLPPESFLLGSGTTEWIFAVPALSGLSRAVIPEPTYADYRDAARMAGLDVEGLELFRGREPLGQEEILEMLQGARLSGSVVFLCNPNNPTGIFLDPGRLLGLISSCRDALFVVDESYAQFIGPDEQTSLLGVSGGRLPENLLLLRSFSKIYGIPGLRVGCLVASGPIMDRLRDMARPWAVNRMAQVALKFFLPRPEIVAETRIYCQGEKAWLANQIEGLPGLLPEVSDTHYFLIRLDQGLKPKEVAGLLKKRRILVRDCSNFRGLEPVYIRISPGLRRDNQVLAKALAEIVSQR